MDVTEVVGEAQRRLRVGALLEGLAIGLIALGASVAVGGLVSGTPAVGTLVGSGAAVVCIVLVARRAAARWTRPAAAALIEARTPGLENLVVTATELTAGTAYASARMRAEVLREAAARAAAVRPGEVAPLGRSVGLALSAAAGATLVIWAAFTATPRDWNPPASSRGSEALLQTIRVTITPPAYLGRPLLTLDDPEQITVPAGSRVRADVRAGTRLVWLEEPDARSRPFTAGDPGAFAIEWVPSGTGVVVVAAGDATGVANQSRVIQLVVEPDQSPRVSVVEPGRDLAFGTPTVVVDLVIDATDREGLDGLRISYVRMSGSGESFAFEEGQVPVAVERSSAQHWRGRARLSLAALTLGDGDSLVYRALVRDSNPSGDWTSSDAYTIDVGRRLELAGAGSAVPDQDRRYALSQQMVIVKTERLQAERAQLSTEQWAERTRLLAMEQRMVRAEVVFLSGGEVQDEVDEAQHSHELQEGRLENAGRAEMLRAINEMSRAEARLNAGDAMAALVSERAALAALQRAFDRRRYFLRTLADRSRIDPTRRLTGDLSGAQSRARATAPEEVDPAASARTLLRELAALTESGDPPPASLLARLASMEPGVAEWRQLAAALAAGGTADARREVARTAMARVAARARDQAGASTPVPALGDLRGWWRDEWQGGGRP